MQRRQNTSTQTKCLRSCSNTVLPAEGGVSLSHQHRVVGFACMRTNLIWPLMRSQFVRCSALKKKTLKLQRLCLASGDYFIHPVDEKTHSNGSVCGPRYVHVRNLGFCLFKRYSRLLSYFFSPTDERFLCQFAAIVSFLGE